MATLLKRFCRHDGGATATEYAMLVVFIALAIAAGAQAFGGGINTFFSNMGAAVAGLRAAL
jgi:Flp pilus assembly pilin Flp